MIPRVDKSNSLPPLPPPNGIHRSSQQAFETRYVSSLSCSSSLRSIFYKAVTHLRILLQKLKEFLCCIPPLKSPSPSIRKHPLVEVWEQTKQAIASKSFTTPDGKRHLLHPEQMRHTRYKNSPASATTSFPSNPQTRMMVDNRDILFVAAEKAREGSKVALLNPANAFFPGGAFLRGARSLEEDLCRRSTLGHFMEECTLQKNSFYPLNTDLIYHEDTEVFRTNEASGFAYIAPFKIDIISSAAPLFPDLTKERTYADPAVEAILISQLDLHLRAAAEKKVDVLILCAFGCGAFGNPPEVVAKHYHTLLCGPYKGAFKEVIFAIIDDSNAGKAHNPHGNFLPFKQVFSS